MSITGQTRSQAQRLRTRVVLSYVVDYVIIIGFAIGFFVIGNIEPYHQHFSLNNISLQYPYATKERVPIWFAVVLSIGVPLVIIAIYTFFIDGLFSNSKQAARSNAMGRYTIGERTWQFNCGLLGLLLAQSSAFIITNALKNACGKPRPDVIDRCQPKPGSKDQAIYGLSNFTICTQTDKAILNDGFRSFPSGELFFDAKMQNPSFAGLTFLTLYLSGKLHLMDNRGEVWKTMIATAPVVGATLIAISRIMDARHHPFDVITGSMLGVLCAWVAYRQYFPPLSDYASKGRAYPIRSWGSQPLSAKPRPVRVHSDEMKLVGGYTDTTAVSAADINREEEDLTEQRQPLQMYSQNTAADMEIGNLGPTTYRGPTARQVPIIQRQESTSQYSSPDPDGTHYAGSIGNDIEMRSASNGHDNTHILRNNTVSTASGGAEGRALVGTTYSPYRTVADEDLKPVVSQGIPVNPRPVY
ncbi:hypothetical protein KEM56_000984 [Ascosphaera pollenicola]|nr:hypothetical protein KEM56_000984 [Ascosphaera pollenicola]